MGRTKAKWIWSKHRVKVYILLLDWIMRGFKQRAIDGDKPSSSIKLGNCLLSRIIINCSRKICIIELIFFRLGKHKVYI
jgi:hypothetical protein